MTKRVAVVVTDTGRFHDFDIDQRITPEGVIKALQLKEPFYVLVRTGGQEFPFDQPLFDSVTDGQKIFVVWCTHSNWGF